MSSLLLLGLGVVLNKIPRIAGLALGGIAGAVWMKTTQVMPLKETVAVLKGQHAGVTLMGTLMEKFYRPILEYAKKEKMAILDLSNAFDPHQDDLYIDKTEPSAVASVKIAEGICHIVKHHNFTASSAIYESVEKSSENIPAKWKVRYPY
jgi:hypothetical protein